MQVTKFNFVHSLVHSTLYNVFFSASAVSKPATATTTSPAAAVNGVSRVSKR